MPPPDGSSARDATEDYAERLRRRTIDGLRFDASERLRVLGLLQSVEAEIVSKLRDADPTGVTQTAAQRRRLEALLRDTRARIRELIRGVRDASQAGLTGFAASEAQWTQSALSRALTSAGIDVSVRVAPSAVLAELAVGNILGLPAKDWWSKQADNLVQRFSQEMRLGVAQGETVDQLIRRVRGTRAGRFRDGIMEATRRQAEALVRTSVNDVGNKARNAVYEANADIISALVHSSTLDSRTTLQCSARDGLAWDMDGKPIGGHNVAYQVPPIHFSCRSVLLPRIGGTARIPGQRASADGPVPASQTFETWLRGKTVADQNDILGPGRARLWREQKLTLTQLLDFKGDPLSLDELTRLYAN